VLAFLQDKAVDIQPPLTIEEELLDEGLNRLERAIADVEEGRVPNSVLTKVQGW